MERADFPVRDDDDPLIEAKKHVLEVRIYQFNQMLELFVSSVFIASLIGAG